MDGQAERPNSGKTSYLILDIKYKPKNLISTIKIGSFYNA